MLSAICLTFLLPNKATICDRACMSSFALKKGYLRDNKERKITPADHISTATKTKYKKGNHLTISELVLYWIKFS